MRDRFRSGEYGPDLLDLMTGALEAAWDQVTASPRDASLARLVLASAILDNVDAGVRAHEKLVAGALAALTAAARISGGDIRY